MDVGQSLRRSPVHRPTRPGRRSDARCRSGRCVRPDGRQPRDGSGVRADCSARRAGRRAQAAYPGRAAPGKPRWRPGRPPRCRRSSPRAKGSCQLRTFIGGAAVRWAWRCWTMTASVAASPKPPALVTSVSPSCCPPLRTPNAMPGAISSIRSIPARPKRRSAPAPSHRPSPPHRVDAACAASRRWQARPGAAAAQRLGSCAGVTGVSPASPGSMGTAGGTLSSRCIGVRQPRAHWASCCRGAQVEGDRRRRRSGAPTRPICWRNRVHGADHAPARMRTGLRALCASSICGAMRAASGRASPAEPASKQPSPSSCAASAITARCASVDGVADDDGALGARSGRPAAPPVVCAGGDRIQPERVHRARASGWPAASADDSPSPALRVVGETALRHRRVTRDRGRPRSSVRCWPGNAGDSTTSCVA